MTVVTPLRKGGAFRVLTEKDGQALDVLRHSGAHVLATAVRRLRPDAKIGFGPAIEEENLGNTSGCSGSVIADSLAWSA